MRQDTLDWSQQPEIRQIIKIEWKLDGTKYYSNSRPDIDYSGNVNVPSPIEAVVLAEDEAAYFLPITNEGSLGDSELELNIWDGDGSFADLVLAEGEGQKCEVYLYFPTEDLLLSVFWGHLRTEEESSAYVWNGMIANGFRSPELALPSRLHFRECSAVFGGELLTQAEITEHGCPYNDHIGGGTGTPGFTTCPRRTIADCTTRGINVLFHQSHATSSVTLINRQTHGPDLLSISRGNEANLDKPVRVVLGLVRVRDMEVIAFRRDFNNNTPDRGWFDGMYEIAEGPIVSIGSPMVNDQNALREGGQHYSQLLGTFGQPAYSPITDHGYSGTSWFRYNFGWVDPSTVGPGSMRGEATIKGLSDVRVYTAIDTYTEIWTDKRIFHIARMLTDKRWGFGIDYARINQQSMLDCDTWDAHAKFTDDESSDWFHRRGECHLELTKGKVQQYIEDACWAGRLSRPFLFQGELHIVPLEALSAAQLAAAPVFSDTPGSTDRSIVWESMSYPGVSAEVEASSLKRKVRSDEELPNRVELTYLSRPDGYVEIPAPPVEDITQQLKAGSVLGDATRRRVVKKDKALGVTNGDHAVTLAHHILWFGKFEEGGTKNNLEITFKIWFLDALDLHEFKVIKVDSDQLKRYGFDYYRVKSLEYGNDLNVTVTAQAYNETEIDAFETTVGVGNPTTGVTIIGATQANPVVVETVGDHGFADGDLAAISGVVGMVEINGMQFIVSPSDSTHLRLYWPPLTLTNAVPPTGSRVPVDGTGFTAYSSGGTIIRIDNIPLPVPPKTEVTAASYTSGVLSVTTGLV